MGKGKKGKMLLSVVGFFIGAGGLNPFGIGAAGASGGLVGGLYGASLAGTLWTTFNKPKQQKYGSDEGGVQRFDKAMNTMTSTAIIPVIYGERKWAGNQTYHKTNPDANMLNKHIMLCEGGIEGVVSVTANDLIIPDTPQAAGTVFTIQNTVHIDATVSVSGKRMRLYANGSAKEIILAGYQDAEDSSLNEYNISISSLVSYINRIGNGWQAYPYATAGSNRSPKDIYDIGGAGCYNTPVPARVESARGNTSYRLYDCALPINYAETGSYKNTAWLDMNLAVSDELNGNPNIACIIRGKKVLDTRTGKVAYSTNPAMCLLDFLTSRRYGMGKWISMDNIDVQSFNEAADYCDAKVWYKGHDGFDRSMKRYELNMVIDSQKSAMDWVGEILSNFCAYIVIGNDKISLRIEKVTPISYKFDKDSIVKDSLTISQMPLDDTPNRYELSFVDPLNNWNTAKIIVENTADQMQRQKIIPKTVELSGVTSQSQVSRLARFYRDLNTVCNINTTFKTAMQGMHLEPGDVITLSYDPIYKNMPFRILEIKESSKGTIEISGRLYNESIYNDDLGASIQIYDYTIMDTPLVGVVPGVKNLRLSQEYFQNKDGSIVSDIIGTFDIPSYPFFDRCHIYYSVDNGGWSYYGENLDGNFMIHNARTLATYRVKIILANTAGRQSEPVISDPIYITGKDEPPSKPTGLAITEYDGGIILNWNANPERDLAGYNVYVGENLASVLESKFVSECHKGTSLTLPITGAGKFAFHVQAVDNSGNKSEVATIEYETTLPPDVESFDVVQTGYNLDFRWQAITGHTYEIRRGGSWEYGETLGRPNNNFFQTIFPIPGDHKFWIKAINRYRNYSINPTLAVMKLLGDNDRNAIYQIHYSENNWNDNRVNFHTTSEGMQLDDNVTYGEYLVPVKLPKKYVTRNWIDSMMIGITEVGTTWNDADFSWGAAEANTSWMPTGNITGTSLKHQISIKNDVASQDIIESFPLDESTYGDIHTTVPTEAKHIRYMKGRFRQGAFIEDTTKLSWKLKIPFVFSMVFYITLTEKIRNDVVYMTLRGDDHWLVVGYDYLTNCFYLEDNNGCRNKVKLDYRKNDYITIGFGQGARNRKLFASSFSTQTSVGSFEDYDPLGSFTDVFCYAIKGVVE